MGWLTWWTPLVVGTAGGTLRAGSAATGGYGGLPRWPWMAHAVRLTCDYRGVGSPTVSSCWGWRHTLKGSWVGWDCCSQGWVLGAPRLCGNWALVAGARGSETQTWGLRRRTKTLLGSSGKLRGRRCRGAIRMMPRWGRSRTLERRHFRDCWMGRRQSMSVSVS